MPALSRIGHVLIELSLHLTAFSSVPIKWASLHLSPCYMQEKDQPAERKVPKTLPAGRRSNGSRYLFLVANHLKVSSSLARSENDLLDCIHEIVELL